MIKPGSIYHLIQVLTKTEKRYIRLQAGKSRRNSNLLMIFDAISVKKLQTDAELREVFQDKKFIQYIDVLKVHLQKLILQSMRQYHQRTDKENELLALISDIRFLLRRSLTSQCIKQIAAARKLAISTRLEQYLPVIIALERSLPELNSATGNSVSAQ